MNALQIFFLALLVAYVILPVIALTWLGSRIAAYFDYQKIVQHRYINHVQGWLIRTFSFGIIAIAFSQLTLHVCQTFIGLAIMCAFLFSSLFRQRLNSLRLRDDHYASPSNEYDSFWIRLSIAKWSPRAVLIRWHRRFYFRKFPSTVRAVHRAGVLAASVEIIVSLASAVYVVFVNIF
jgi:hypothetical protein